MGTIKAQDAEKSKTTESRWCRNTRKVPALSVRTRFLFAANFLCSSCIASGSSGQFFAEDPDAVLVVIGGLLSRPHQRSPDLPSAVLLVIGNALYHVPIPYPPLKVPTLISFSACAVTKVASRSTMCVFNRVANAVGFRFPPDLRTQPPAEGGKAVVECLRLVGGTFHAPRHRRVRENRAEESGAASQDVEFRRRVPRFLPTYRQGAQDPALPVRGLVRAKLRKYVLTQPLESHHNH